MSGNEYIATLSSDLQKEIEGDLNAFFSSLGLTDSELIEAVENGLNSRLNDLQDVLNTDKYIYN